jgi:hypothetical protein
MDMEGNGDGLIEGSIPVFFWISLRETTESLGQDD